jgi:ribosomal protein S18 acetylase RimI-like enzyme
MLIRDATPDDAPAIAAVHVRSWQIAYRGIVPDDVLDGLSVARREADWRVWITEATSVLVAVEAETVIGFCGVSGSEIAALYVDPPQFRAGIGSALLLASLQRLRERGVAHATLWVFQANHGARAFYARHGFEPDTATNEAIAGTPEIRLRTAL